MGTPFYVVSVYFNHHKKKHVMRDLLWLVAIILLIGWLVGFFGFGEAVGSFIHILLVLAIVAVLVRLIFGRG